MIGIKLGLRWGGGATLVQQALSILAKYGSAANLYLPGVGTVSGIQAGNWIDSAGGTAATVDNPVGLVVSAGKAVGSELVTNGDFSNGATGWIAPAGWSIGSGVATATATGATLRNEGLVVTGNSYLVEFDYTHTSGTLYVRVAAGPDTVFTSSGRKSLVCVAGAATTRVVEFYGGLVTGVIDNISVRELTGAHLTQPTTANKPILRLAGGVYAWDFVSSDSFSSSMTLGDAGFLCMAAKFNDGGVARTLIGCGAGSSSEAGVWLARNSINELRLQVGNGSTLNTVVASYPALATSVASAGWDTSSMFVGVGRSEASGAKSVNCTSSNTMNLGVLTGTTNPMLGTIGATIIMPTVLPTASERATLRRFIASLSGVTL